MLDRTLRRALLFCLLGSLLFTGCSRFRNGKEKPDGLSPAANPAVAAATNFSITVVDVNIERRGTIATGSIKLDAPLAQATSGTFSLSPSPSRSVQATGKHVATLLQANRSGRINVTHSGNLTILEFRTKDGETIMKVIGPPHGNTIKDHWFHLGSDCGLATISPRS